MKNLIFALLLIVHSCSLAQSDIYFGGVMIPDSIRYGMALIELNKKELKTIFDSTYAAIYVFNLVQPKQSKLTPSIYTWKVMGPHFQRRLFIYDGKRFFLFTGLDFNNILREYSESLQLLNLSSIQKKVYLKLIVKYLDSIEE